MVKKVYLQLLLCSVLTCISLINTPVVIGARSDLGTLAPDYISSPSFSINNTVERFAYFAITISGVVFLAMFSWGALQWLTAGADQKAVQAARGRITHAVIGLILIACAYAIFTIVKIITYNP